MEFSRKAQNLLILTTCIQADLRPALGLWATLVHLIVQSRAEQTGAHLQVPQEGSSRFLPINKYRGLPEVQI